MDERTALHRIQALALGNWIIFTRHASEEMRDEMMTEEEVRGALLHLSGCEEQTNGRWLVHGGSDLEIVVDLQEELVVVTVFGRHDR